MANVLARIFVQQLYVDLEENASGTRKLANPRVPVEKAVVEYDARIRLDASKIRKLAEDSAVRISNLKKNNSTINSRSKR